MLMGLAPALFFGGLRSVPAALLLRGLQLRSLAIREFFGVAAGGVVGIAGALSGWGAWSLVAQTLTDSAVGALLLWMQVDWRPRLRFSRRHFRDLFGFSVRIFGSQVLVQAFRRSDDLLIGGVLGPVPLGLYSVAYRLMTIFNEMFVRSLSKVMFPAVAQLQDDLVRLERAMYKAVGLTSVLAVPAFVGMGIVAPELVVLVFGEEWREAGPIAAMLAVGGLPLPLWTMLMQLLNGTGNAGLALRSHLANAVISIVGFALAVSHGIFAVAAVFAARGFLVLPIAGRFTRRSTGIGLRPMLRASTPSSVAGAVMAVVGLLMRRVLVEVPELALALGAGASGGAAYLGMLAIVIPVLRELWDTFTTVGRGSALLDRAGSAAFDGVGSADPDER
ncbi:MAG: lipopolysaccharide biosynthesis protein [Acidimicrobiales bacterium]|nr:lipopolysaccharide biosynthesis protein [Acidimicrobiales bacterium]